MTFRIAVPIAAALAFTSFSFGQQAAKPTARDAAHPNLSGTWAIAVDTSHTALKVSKDGQGTELKEIDLSARWVQPKDLPGAKAWMATPTYKPEHLERVKYLDEHESKEDPVFYCGRPGVPRIGPPRRIIQSANEVIFFYEDMSGDTYRVIPTDGRKHREDANPSYYGNSVAHWEGGTLVVEAKDFVDDTWLGERGYFHTEALKVTERIWRDGKNLIYQATADDPGVLSQPWVMAPHVVQPSAEPLEESPACKEQDAHLLINNDHHGQR